MREICNDVAAEHEEVDAMVRLLTDSEWDIATPADGWCVRDQVSHLWFGDRMAHLAIADPKQFLAVAESHMEDASGRDADTALGRDMPPAEVLARWQSDRRALLERARAVNPADRIDWFGPSMSARSFLTARLMEAWAHGQDIADALGVIRQPTPRLRHVAHLGVLALPFSYDVHGRPRPQADVYVCLQGPDGERWTWGEQTAKNVIRGSGLDFSLVVTQRRHVDDTSIEVAGDVAREWMSIAKLSRARQVRADDPGNSPDPS